MSMISSLLPAAGIIGNIMSPAVKDWKLDHYKDPRVAEAENQLMRQQEANSSINPQAMARKASAPINSAMDSAARYGAMGAGQTLSGGDIGGNQNAIAKSTQVAGAMAPYAQQLSGIQQQAGQMEMQKVGQGAGIAAQLGETADKYDRTWRPLEEGGIVNNALTGAQAGQKAGDIYESLFSKGTGDGNGNGGGGGGGGEESNIYDIPDLSLTINEDNESNGNTPQQPNQFVGPMQFVGPTQQGNTPWRPGQGYGNSLYNKIMNQGR